MKTSSKRSSSPRLPDASGAPRGARPDGGPHSAPGDTRTTDRATPLPKPGFVDVHVHVFPPEMIRDREAYLDRDARFGALHRSPTAPMATAEQVVAHMDEVGVDVSVVVGFAFAGQGLCRMVNDYLLEVVGKYPDRLAGLACVAPGAPGARAELERCLDAGLRGCGELAPSADDLAGGAPGRGRGLLDIAGCLKERGLPLLVHASEPIGHRYPGKGGFTPELCYQLAEACPGTALILAHMGGGLFLYEAMPEVRRTLADVCYDTAAVPYLYGPEIYDAAISTAGPEKFLFGSDYPLLSPARYIEGLERLDVATRTAVQGGNARRVFGL
jgi:predicted TIM-barrel fold metal-dependent hydrolase